MATSLLSVPLPKGVWVDLYVATSIVAGTQLIIQNLGNSNAKLTESATEPAGVDTVGGNTITGKEFLTNKTANVGAWAFSWAGTTLQIEES